MDTCTNTQTMLHIPIHVQTCNHIQYTHTHKNTHAQPCTLTHTQRRMHKYTHRKTYIYTFIHIHAHAKRGHTHRYTYIRIQSFSLDHFASDPLESRVPVVSSVDSRKNSFCRNPSGVKARIILYISSRGSHACVRLPSVEVCRKVNVNSR